MNKAKRPVEEANRQQEDRSALHVPANFTPAIAGGGTQNCPTRAREEEPARAYTDQALLVALAPKTLAGRSKPNKRHNRGEGEGRKRAKSRRAQSQHSTGNSRQVKLNDEATAWRHRATHGPTYGGGKQAQRSGWGWPTAADWGSGICTRWAPGHQLDK